MSHSKSQALAAPKASPQPLKEESKTLSGRKKPRHKGKAKDVAQAPSDGGTTPGAQDVGAVKAPSLSNVSPWNWVSLTESGSSSLPTLFTRDGSYFFSVVGSSIKIHSTSTGDLVSTISASPAVQVTSDLEQSSKITGVTLAPGNVFQLITCSLDGIIRVWDFLDGTLLQSIDIGQPIYRMCAHESLPDYVFVVCRVASKGKEKNSAIVQDNSIALRISLKQSESAAESTRLRPSEITPIGKTRFPTGMGISASGEWLVVTGGHKAYVAQTAALKAGFTKFVSPEALTALALHPSEDYFSTGDRTGVIRLWYCLQKDLMKKEAGVEKRAQTTTLHWHAHAVVALAYTPNGAYLLSGGEEAVLVLWQLHSGKKEFIPRVGSPIVSIAISPASRQEEEYFLGLADASYAVISSSMMKVTRVFSRIKLEPSSLYGLDRDAAFAPLTVHNQHSTIILPSSHPSSLQIYSPASSRVVMDLEVSPSNRVSRRDDAPIEPSRVVACVLSISGDWMATIDSRAATIDSFRSEICLKIWLWDRKSMQWVLNTRIDRPHGLQAVTSLAFDPSASVSGVSHLVTTGRDGTIKMWRLRVNSNKGDTSEQFWVLRSSTSFRGEAPNHATWSPDGSLLVVALGQYAVLYEPVTNAVLKPLTVAQSDDVLSTHFMGSNGRYLAAVSKRNIVLWDLLDGEVRWQYHSSSSISHAIRHPDHESIIVLVDIAAQPEHQLSSEVLEFGSSSSDPLRVHSLPFQLRNLTTYVSGSLLKPTSYSLLGITQTWNVVLFGDEIHAPQEAGTHVRDISSTPGAGPSRTLFQDIFGESAFTNLGSISAEVPSGSEMAHTLARVDPSVTRSLSAAPAYLMPPIESLYDSVIGELVKPMRSDSRDNDTEGLVEEDIAEMEDEDMAVGSVDSEAHISSHMNKLDVDDAQMKELIGFFMQHAVVEASSIDRPVANEPKAVKKAEANRSRAVKPIYANGTIPAEPYVLEENMTEPNTEASSPKIGKKRKKQQRV